MGEWTGSIHTPKTPIDALRVAVRELEQHQDEYEYRTHFATLMALREVLKDMEASEK